LFFFSFALCGLSNSVEREYNDGISTVDKKNEREKKDTPFSYKIKKE
jgi:hypothetical protein